MKIQDIGFIAVLLVVLVMRKPRLCVVVGLVCFGLSIPLFATWTFFTAQRLTYYAGAFILHAVLLQLFRARRRSD